MGKYLSLNFSLLDFLKMFYWFSVNFRSITLIFLPLHICPLPFKSPQKGVLIENKNKRNKSHHGGCSVSRYVTHRPFFLPNQHYLQMFIAIRHWSGSMSLASNAFSILDHHLNSSWLSCCWPVLVLHVWPLCSSSS